MSQFAVRTEREGKISWSGPYSELARAKQSAERALRFGAVQADVYAGGLFSAGRDGAEPLYSAQPRTRPPGPRSRLSALASRLPGESGPEADLLRSRAAAGASLLTISSC